MEHSNAFSLGVIADTHGLMRPAALSALEGCDLILHAGDIGDPGILQALAAIAPVQAVRGNIDTAPWCADIPLEWQGNCAGSSIYMVHRRQDADPAQAAAADLVVFGHSHQPLLEQVGHTWWLNPGSAGRRRFSLPICLSRVSLGPGGFRHQRIDLPV